MILTDTDIARAVEAAGLLAEPVRTQLLLELEAGALSVNELAARLGLAQPRASAHLAVLRDAGWVAPLASGRQRRYQLCLPRVPDVIRDLAALNASAPPQPRRTSALTRKPRASEPARAARTCYDHLAGVAGVALCDGLLARGWLEPVAGRGRHQPDYALTEVGRAALTTRGVQLPEPQRGSRRLAYACPDWTEARPHVGGALGAAILERLYADGFVRQEPGTRLAHVERELAAWFA